jgi:hypothetical protein
MATAALCLLGASCAMKAERKSLLLPEAQKGNNRYPEQLPDPLQPPAIFLWLHRPVVKYFVMQIMTDSVDILQYQNKAALYKVLGIVQYDTSRLRLMANQMKAMKLLWMDKTSFWVNEKEVIITFLSFKSVTVEAPFSENKYYILLFTDERLDIPEIRERLKRGDSW